MTTFDRSTLDSSLASLIAFFSGDTFAYIVKRLLQGLLTLFLASALCFIIIQLAPGDYLDTLKENPKISPERIEQLRKQFGLDKSWIEQYFRWLWQVITQGNFGTSFVYQRSVASLLWERVPATLLMAVCSLVVTWAVAIPSVSSVPLIRTVGSIDFCKLLAIPDKAFLASLRH